MTNNILYILLISSLISCNIPSDKTATIPTLEFSDEYCDLSDSLDFKFIPLETNTECLVGYVANVIMTNDRLFVLDTHSNSLFVFDSDGRFMTKIGSIGAGPEEYSKLFDFDINTKNRIIALSDRHRERLYFYDLNTFQFKYSKRTHFYYSKFKLLDNGNIAFFYYSGYKDILDKKGPYYVQITDSLLKPVDVIYEAPFTTSYSLVNDNSNFYSYNNSTFVFHHLFPEVYQLEDNQLKAKYKIYLHPYKFPSVDFLKEAAGDNHDYTQTLSSSDYIVNYAIYKSTDLLYLSIQRKRELIHAISFNNAAKGHVYDMKNYFKSIGLGILLLPVGATDEYIIGDVRLDKNSLKYIKNEDLKKIVENRAVDDNPVLCLIKPKNTLQE